MDVSKKLTAELAEDIFSFAQQGHYFASACNKAGVSLGEHEQWEALAAKGVEPYTQFVKDCDEAQEKFLDILRHEVAAKLASELPTTQLQVQEKKLNPPSNGFGEGLHFDG